MTEPARMTLERTLLRGRQTWLPDRVPGDPHFRHNGSSTAAGRQAPPTSGRSREDIPALNFIAPPQATGHIDQAQP